MKKSYLFLFGLLFLFSSSVSAHTGLENSSPADGDTVTEEIQDISLTFETVIEEGSSFTLRDEAGEVSVENVKVTENVLSGTAADPLENGSYTVDWKIIGEDGHLIEGTYGFTVAVEQAAEPAPEEEPVEEDTELTNTEENTAANSQDNSSSATAVMPIVIGIVVVLALAFAVLLMRKGKK
ncbi:copper resistance CopC family protein [Domibacillus indicus]|uniref:copper resistance CopC family protein n=1 Tax=Domibacillus indicus TaxID=1437523 RepID=UPI000696440C|nr:copper resistance CopC family protein [Domibacillus indicus]